MLSAARFQALHQGLTSTARKVYDCVPIAETWNAHRIHSELARVGSRVDFRIFLGCMKALLEAGLVVEPSAGMLKRTPVKTPPLQAVPSSLASTERICVPMPQTSPAAAAPAKKPDGSAMDKVGTLAARVRRLSTEAASIAADLETLAIELGEQDQANAEAAETLRTLRQLLRQA